MKTFATMVALAIMGLSGYGVYWGWETHSEAGVVASGKGTPGVMNYVDSETTTTYVPMTIGNTTTMMPQTTTNYYGKFVAANDKVLSSRAYISGDFDMNSSNKAVFYNGSIYTDGGSSENMDAWIIIIGAIIGFMVGVWLMYMVVDDYRCGG